MTSATLQVAGSMKATAKAVGRVADAVVIGSRIIQLLEAAPKGQEVAAAQDFLTGIREALDA